MPTPDFYWLRQPLLSMERLLKALAQDQVAELLREEQVVEAIRIASPSFAGQLRAGLAGDSKGMEAALKYLLRMSTRCTPFGLFAGGAVGYQGVSSCFDCQDRQLRVQHRLDTQVMIRIVRALSNQPALQKQLRYYTNGSLHQVGSRLRYLERCWTEDQWTYFTSEVPASPLLLSILELARQGANWSELVSLVALETDQTQATGFIGQLIADDLLQSELALTPSGTDPLTRLIEALKVLPTPPTELADLERIQAWLVPTDQLESPMEVIRTLLVDHFGLAASQATLLQTDMRVTNVQNQLKRATLSQLERRLNALWPLGRFIQEPADLTVFKQRFYERYEEQEVPLLQVLDEEVGIGYGQSVGTMSSVEELIRQRQNPSEPHATSSFPADALHVLRLKLYANWSPHTSEPVEITDQDLALLGPDPDHLPPSYYALGYFLAPDTAAIDRGDYQFYLKALTGPSAFTLLGRFCTTDPTLEALVTGQLASQQREQPERLLAEVVHLPQARTGNVVQRPHLRGYEIPLLTRSTLPPDYQLALADLTVSVPNGQQVVIRSQRLGKHVLPQLTTAHDYRYGLPIYRFLCDLQHQHVPYSVGWHWGAFAQARRLPRVTYKNIILHEASWSCNASDLTSSLSDRENVQRLKVLEQLPRYVAVQQGDQELFLDLATAACQQLFCSTLRRIGRCQVIEWLRTPEKCPVDGPDGKLTHEVILPFCASTTGNVAHPLTTRIPQTASTLVSQRSFPPGSKWLYIKVYCGVSTANLVVSELVKVAEQALATGQITHWFFVRYQDPEPHLRVRFCLSSISHYGSLLTTCQQALASFLLSGEMHRFSTDTYQREIERYGDTTIEETERIFWRDSKLVCQLLMQDLDEASLLMVAVKVVDGYQTACNLGAKAKQQLCTRVFTELFNQQGTSADLRQELAKKYRTHQSWMINLLQPDLSEGDTSINQLLQQHFESIEQELATVMTRSIETDAHLVHQYVIDVCHMFINRLFNTYQRAYELVVYHHLYRAHQSINARSIKSEPRTEKTKIINKTIES